MNRFRHTLPLVILFAAPVLYADEPTSADLEFFEKKIRPVLVSHCYLSRIASDCLSLWQRQQMNADMGNSW